jgi:L-asparagine transporter-like permease
MFPWPRYRKNTFLLVTSVFGITYILVGTVAGNCLIFGIRILEAADATVTKWKVIALAITAATVACGIHSFSRTGGIYISNTFAFIKVLMLLMMIIVGIAAWLKGFHTETYAGENLSSSKSFSGASNDSFGYVEAFLAVIFAYGGIDQPNYVSFSLMRLELILLNNVRF